MSINFFDRVQIKKTLLALLVEKDWTIVSDTMDTLIWSCLCSTSGTFLQSFPFYNQYARSVFFFFFFSSVIALICSILYILQVCSKVLLNERLRQNVRHRVLNPDLSYLSRKALRKEILEKCKKVTTCPHCGSLNGVVKKCGLLKIVHDKYRSKKKTDIVVKNVLGKWLLRVSDAQ